MADRTERIQIQVSALAEFGQALSNLARLQQQGLDPATRSSARFSEEFRRITEVAQQVGSALRQTQAFAQGLGDTSATTALRFQRLSESLNNSQNALRGVENEYAANQVRLVQLNASLGDLQNRQQQANAALQQAERGSEAYERHRRAVQELEAELRRVLTAIEAETRAQNQLQRQANELSNEITQVNEALRTEAARMQDTAQQAERLAEEQNRLNLAQTSFSGVMGTVSNGLKIVAELFSRGSNFAHQFGFALSAGLTVPMSLAGGASVKMAGDLQTAIQNIKSIKPSIDTSVVFKALNEMSTRVPKSAEELAEGLYNVFSTVDVSQAEALRLTEAIARGATAGRAEMDEWANATLGVINAYKMQANQIGRVNDVMFKAIADGVVNGKELANGLGEVTGSARSANVTLEEMGALIIGVTKEAGPAAQNLNNLKNFFDKVYSKESTKALDNLLGKNAAVDAEGNLVPVIQVIEKLKLKLESLSEGDRLKALQEIFPDSQARQAAERLMRSIDLVKTKLGEIKGGSGSTDAAFDTQMQGFNNQIALMENKFRAAGRVIGASLLPVLTPVLDFVNGTVLPVLDTVAQWFSSQSLAAKTFMAVIALVVGAIGPIAVIIGVVIGAVGSLIAAISAIASAIAAVGLPAILAGIGGIVVVLAEVATVAVGMATAIYTAWKNNFGNIQGITAQVLDNVKRLLAEATAFWERNGEKIKSATMAVLKVGEYVVRYYAELLLPLVKKFADGVVEAVRIVLRVIEGAIYYAEQLAEAYEVAVGGIKLVFASLPEPVRKILEQVAVEAKFWVGVAYESGKLLGQAIIRGILAALTGGASEVFFLLGEISSQSPGATGSATPQTSGGDDLGRATAQMEHDRVLARIPKTKGKGKPGGGGGGGGGKDQASEFARFLEAAKILQSINDEALADMKQSADDAVKINADLIEREKTQVEAARAAGLIGATEYYRSLANLGETQAQMDVARVEEEIRIEREREQQILAALEAIAAKRAELAKRGVKESADDAKARAEAERDLNAKLGDSKRTIQGLTTDLEIAQRKRQDAAIEGQRKVNQGLREEQKALDELEQQYFDLTATDAEKRRAAVYKEADAKLEEIRKGLSGSVSATGDDPEAQKKLLESLDELERRRYENVLKKRALDLAQIEFDERLVAIAEIQNRLKEQEANLDREALKLSISQYEVEARKKAMREGAAAAIEKEIAAMRALLSKNPSINNQQNRLSLEGAQRSVDDLRFNMSSLDQDLRQNLTQSFEGFFKNIMTGAQGAAEAFRGFVGSVLGGITQMIAKLLALWVVQKLVGFVAGAFGGGSLGGLGSGAAGAGQGAGSSIGSIASGVIGGGRAKGGDVREGVPYLVGEERPEIFVPGASGWIYPSVKDFAKSLMPRGLGGNLPMPQAANFKGGGNTTNEYLFATLFDKKSLQSLIKSKPLAQTIVQIVSENMNTIRKAGGF